MAMKENDCITIKQIKMYRNVYGHAHFSERFFRKLRHYLAI